MESSKTFKDVREIAATILCLAAAAAVLFVARAVNRIADTADTARVQAITEIGAARADLTARIDSAAAAAVGEIQATRAEASRQITVTREAAVNELEAARGDLQTAVAASLTLANKHASKIEDQVVDILPALKHGDSRFTESSLCTITCTQDLQFLHGLTPPVRRPIHCVRH